MKKIIISGVTVLIVIIILAMTPFTLIGAGHRGVVTEFGKVQDIVLGEGFHFINPLWSVNEYDVRVQKTEVSASAASKDLQSVSAVIAINFRVNPELVKSLYQETQGDYNVTLIAPAVQESIKASTAKFTADELITKRAEVKDEMITLLKNRPSVKFFIIEDLSIVNFDFSDSFNAAIEKKVTAEQDALAAKNKLEQTKYEAEQKIVSATAEAEAIRIQAEAITSQGGDDYVQLQAVAKWNGILPTYIMGGTAMPFINIK